MGYFASVLPYTPVRLASTRFARDAGILLSSVLIVLGGCRTAPVTGRDGAAVAWPDVILGRTLVADSGNSVVYATDRAAGRNLADAVQHDLDAFKARYPTLDHGKGIVFSLEPGLEQEAIAGPLVPVDHTVRPYTLFRDAYFRESYRVDTNRSVRDAVGADIPSFDWVCFLATDELQQESFDRRLAEHRQAVREDMRRVPPEVRALNALSAPLILWFAEFAYAKAEGLDLQLMRIQRRETLWEAVLDAAAPSQAFTEREHSRLIAEVDQKWDEIWRRRPQD